MSFQTTAILFFGFPIDKPEGSDLAEPDEHCHQGIFGSDGNATTYVAITASQVEADLDDCVRLTDLTAMDEWRTLLRAFCAAHDIQHTEPAWYLAPSRF